MRTCHQFGAIRRWRAGIFQLVTPGSKQGAAIVVNLPAMRGEKEFWTITEEAFSRTQKSEKLGPFNVHLDEVRGSQPLCLDELIQRRTLDGEISARLEFPHGASFLGGERGGPDTIGNSELEEFHVLNAVEFKVFAKVGSIRRKRFERIHWPGSHQHSGKQRIESSVRSYIVKYRAGAEFPHHAFLHFEFIAAKPATVQMGAHNPFLAAQRTLQNGYGHLPGKEAQGNPDDFPRQGFRADGREVKQIVF